MREMSLGVVVVVAAGLLAGPVAAAAAAAVAAAAVGGHWRLQGYADPWAWAAVGLRAERDRGGWK